MTYADVVKLHERWMNNAPQYVPASEIRPEQIVLHVQVLREKVREQDTEIARLKKCIMILQNKAGVSLI